MASFEFTIQGHDAAIKSYDAIAQRAQDMTPFMKRAAAYLQRHTHQVFQRQADPVTGAAWAPLSGLTLGARRGSTALRDSHLLLKSFTSNPEVTPHSVKLSTNRPGATMHQRGGTIKPKNAKHLAVPLTKDVKGFGSARSWWGANEARKPFIWSKKSFDEDGGFGASRKFIATGDEGKLKLHYILLDQVTIPQRRFAGVNQQNIDELGGMLVKWVAGATGAQA